MKFGPRRFPFGITGDTHRIGPLVGPDQSSVVAPGKEVGIKATVANEMVADTVPVAVDRSGQPHHAGSVLDSGCRPAMILVATGWRVPRCGSDPRQMFKGGVEVASLAVHHQVDGPTPAGTVAMVEELTAVDAEDGTRAFPAGTIRRILPVPAGGGNSCEIQFSQAVGSLGPLVSHRSSSARAPSTCCARTVREALFWNAATSDKWASHLPMKLQRYVVAHECAHFVLHRSLLHASLHHWILDDAFFRSPFIPIQVEEEAHQWAMDILMPLPLLEAELEDVGPLDEKAMTELADRFWVATGRLQTRLIRMDAGGSLST